METIYDVFRLLVNAGRHVLSDVEIAQAHAIIDAADPSVPGKEVKADAEADS